MNINGFYLLKEKYINLIENLGGTYSDSKERPIYCCIEDKYISGLYWAIPTSNIAHRTSKQMERINKYCAYSKHDIRSAFYHIGETNRPAIFKISNALPISEEYIEKEYFSKGSQLTMQDNQQIKTIEQKLIQILAYEGRFPNRLEQHITDVKNFIVYQLENSQCSENEIEDDLEME